MIKPLFLIAFLVISATELRAQQARFETRDPRARIHGMAAAKASVVMPTNPTVSQAIASTHRRKNQFFRKPTAMLKSWIKSNSPTLSIWATDLPVQRWTK